MIAWMLEPMLSQAVQITSRQMRKSNNHVRARSSQLLSFLVSTLDRPPSVSGTVVTSQAKLLRKDRGSTSTSADRRSNRWRVADRLPLIPYHAPHPYGAHLNPISSSSPGGTGSKSRILACSSSE